ncbi:MAG: oligoendopeptidase F [Thermoplasmatota archaeon]
METAEQVPGRGTIDEIWKWDLTPLFGSSDQWEKEFSEVESEYGHLATFKGRLSASNENIVEYISYSDELSRKLERIFTWAHLKHDEDLNDTHFQSLHDRAINLMTRIETETSFFVPELLSFPKDKLDHLLVDPSLEFARVPLRSIIRQRDHFLNESEERLMAMAQEALEASSKTFRMLNDADLKFPSVKDEEGREVEISHGRFISLLLSRSREVRKNTLQGFYSSYRSHKNTFASLIEGELKSRAFRAKARNYPSALHASLDSDEVTPDLYNGLIEAVHSRLPDFYGYVDLRKKALGTDELHMYDVYVSLIDDFEKKVTFDEARDIVLEALKPLGGEILDIVKKGLSSRWIDVYENRGKRSGAYSSGCYDSPPFILMNYENNVRELFTLAHEMGHSVHSYLANRNQPHLTADYRIFVAEVASTVNEILLLDHLKAVWTEKSEQAFLVNHHLENFKGTVFRQTMFAEFERDIQQMVEKGVPLTPDILTDHYGKLNREYFGPGMIIDPEIELEWARIPHFYYNFYVYKYATSYSVANAIASRILAGDHEQLERYIEMLKAGGSKPPVDLLIDAGVDLRTPEPIKEALEVFSSLVKEMEGLL